MKSVAIDEKEHRKNSPPDDNENQIETWIAAVFPIPTPFQSEPNQNKSIEFDFDSKFHRLFAM